MKHFFMVICLLGTVITVAANNTVRQVNADWKEVTRDRGKKSKKAAASGQELIKPTSKNIRDLRTKQSRELRMLREMHDQQKSLLNIRLRSGKESMPGQNKARDYPDYRMQIRRSAMALEGTIKALGKFPFANRLHEIDKVVLSISSGKMKYGEVTGKTPQKVLKAIQDDQERMLRDYNKQQMKSFKSVRKKDR